MDILHVATAIELGAKEFLTFDANQKKLAEAEGLLVPVR
jgi:predicted nucleic acid-binding protein